MIIWRRFKEWLLGYRTVIGIDGDHYVVARHITRGKRKGVMIIINEGTIQCT